MKKVITKFGYIFAVATIVSIAFTSCTKDQETYTPESSANVDSQELPVPPTINKELKSGLDEDVYVVRTKIKKNGSVIYDAEVGMRSEPQGFYSDIQYSDSLGFCDFENVTTGIYVLEVHKVGFQSIIDTLTISDSTYVEYMMQESI